MGSTEEGEELNCSIHLLLLALNCPLFLSPLHFQISLYFRDFPFCNAILYLDREIQNTKTSRTEIKNAVYECLSVCWSEHEMILKAMVKPVYFVIFCQALLALWYILTKFCPLFSLGNYMLLPLQMCKK